MLFQVVTLLPELFENFLEKGVVGQAHQAEKFQVRITNPRDFATDNYKTVDDRPFGGGDSMVLMIEPLQKAMEQIGVKPLSPTLRKQRVIYLSPQGSQWTDQKAREISSEEEVVLICGRYGGVDERFLAQYVTEEISIGDYVLSGGELGAMVMIDSVVRMLPGVLGNDVSCQKESFADGLLEAPLYTRPRVHQGREVPTVLLSGNHPEIENWRRLVSILRTFFRRPDLLQNARLSPAEVDNASKFYATLTPEGRANLGLPAYNEIIPNSPKEAST